MLVVGFLPGRTLEAADLRDPQMLPRAAAAVRALHARAGVRRRLRHAVDPAPVPRHRASTAGSGCRRTTTTSRRWSRRSRTRMRPGDEPLVPCNNDLLAANFIDDGDRVWLIDYEYSGMNEASFELGNIASESGLDVPTTRLLVDAYWGARRPAQARPRAGVVAARAVRLDAVGVDPGQRLADRLRLLGLGHGEVRLRARRAARPRVRRDPRGAGMSDGAPGPCPRRRHRRRRRGHEHRAPPRPARRDRRACCSSAAELTSGSTFHSAGLVGQLRGSVTLTRMMMDSADLYRSLARGPRDRPGLGRVRRPAAGLHAGADGGAGAAGRLGRDVRPRAAPALRATRRASCSR